MHDHKKIMQDHNRSLMALLGIMYMGTQGIENVKQRFYYFITLHFLFN